MSIQMSELALNGLISRLELESYVWSGRLNDIIASYEKYGDLSTDAKRDLRRTMTRLEYMAEDIAKMLRDDEAQRWTAA